MKFTKSKSGDLKATRVDGVVLTIEQCDDYVALRYSDDDDYADTFDSVKLAKAHANKVERRMK